MTPDEPVSFGIGQSASGDTPILITGQHTPRFIDLRKAAAALWARTRRPAFQRLAQLTDFKAILNEAGGSAILHEIAGEAAGIEATEIHTAPALACPLQPGQVFCVGMNIAQLFVPEKITGKMPLIREAPSAAPFWWMKAASAVTGPTDDIIHPGAWHTRRLIPEPELGLVIGRPMGPGIASPKAADALTYLAGYCVFNDVSALDIEVERGGDPFAFYMSWSKSYPSFAPLGPVVTLPSGIDPMNLAVGMWINGEQKVRENTASYLWSAQELLEHFAAVVTLWPGDVIACGNLTGEHRIAPGDLVEIDIEKIGRLANRVVASPGETRYRVPEKVTDYARRFTQTVASIGIAKT